MDAGGLLLFWVGFSVVVAIAAANRGRSAVGWFLIAIFLSPVLALIAVLVMAPGGAKVLPPQQVAYTAPVAEPRKPCPDCGEQVPLIARICRFCRYDFTQGGPGGGNAIQPQQAAYAPAPADPRKPCPQCGEQVPLAARFCRCIFEFKDLPQTGPLFRKDQ